MSRTPSEPCQGSSPSQSPPCQGSARFAKTDRLRRRREFLQAQATGRRLHTPHFGLTLAPAVTGRLRLGLVATKRLGKAARRNRVKRLLREFFRRHKTELPTRDLVILAKKGASELSYQEVEAELSRVLLTPGQKQAAGPVSGKN